MVDERGQLYFYATYLPKVIGAGSFYLMGIRDGDGALMAGKDTYKLTVSADTPATDFWSVIVYSTKTKGFVRVAPGRSDRFGYQDARSPPARVGQTLDPRPGLDRFRNAWDFTDSSGSSGCPDSAD